MRWTWSEYTRLHQIDSQIVNQVKYYLESRGVLIAQKEAEYSDSEWWHTIKAAQSWWKELVSGTFAGWD